MTSRFAGAVLAGGASTRMGTDKAFVRLDGQPLILRAVGALTEAGASPISVVGGDQAGLSALGLSVVGDMSPGDGPAQAILTALDLGTHPDLMVVLACDLIDPRAGAITAVVAELEASPDAAVAVPMVDGRRQWLHACWRRSQAVPLLAEARTRGERSIWGSVTDEVVIDVEGVAPGAVVDADRPEDLPPSRPR